MWSCKFIIAFYVSYCSTAFSYQRAPSHQLKSEMPQWSPGRSLERYCYVIAWRVVITGTTFLPTLTPLHVLISHRIYAKLTTTYWDCCGSCSLLPLLRWTAVVFTTNIWHNHFRNKNNVFCGNAATAIISHTLFVYLWLAYLLRCYY